MHKLNFLNFLISYCKCGFKLAPSWPQVGSNWPQGGSERHFRTPKSWPVVRAKKILTFDLLFL